MWQRQETANGNNNGYDTERTEFLALSALYSLDPYDVQYDRRDEDPKCIGGQNKDNYSFQNHHYSLLLSVHQILCQASLDYSLNLTSI